MKTNDVTLVNPIANIFKQPTTAAAALKHFPAKPQDEPLNNQFFSLLFDDKAPESKILSKAFQYFEIMAT